MTTRASDHLTAAVDGTAVGLAGLLLADLTLSESIVIGLLVYAAMVAVFTLHRRHGLRLRAGVRDVARVTPTPAPVVVRRRSIHDIER